MIELKQNQIVLFEEQEARIVGFMNDGKILIEQFGSTFYVSRYDLEVI